MNRVRHAARWVASALLGGAVLFGAIRVGSMLVSLPQRLLWIDEFLGIARIWEAHPFWLYTYSATEVLYLLPLRFLPADPLDVLVGYRFVSMGVALAAIGYAARRIWTSATGRWDRLVPLAGLATLAVFWAYAAVARPYGLGLSGVALLAAAPAESRVRWLGVALAILQPVTALFAVIALALSATRRQLFAVGAILAVFYSPLILATLAPSVAAPLLRPFEVAVRDALVAIPPFSPLGNFPFLDHVFLFGVGSATLAVAAVFLPLELLRSKGRSRASWVGLAYVAALVVLRLMGVPVLLRYVAPLALWLWLAIVPNHLSAAPFRGRRAVVAAALLLVAWQALAFGVSPTDRHWEGPLPVLTEADRELVAARGCHVGVRGDGALETMLGLGQLLVTGLWMSPADRNAPCSVDLEGPMAEVFFEGSEPRFRELFGPPTSTPPTLVTEVRLGDHLAADGAPIEPGPDRPGYEARVEGPFVVYTIE